MLLRLLLLVIQPPSLRLFRRGQLLPRIQRQRHPGRQQRLRPRNQRLQVLLPRLLPQQDQQQLRQRPLAQARQALDPCRPLSPVLPLANGPLRLPPVPCDLQALGRVVVDLQPAKDRRFAPAKERPADELVHRRV